jgi:aspartyl aminopeptidase
MKSTKRKIIRSSKCILEVFMENLKHEFKNVWKECDNLDAIMKYSKEYMHFLDVGKTERESAKEIVRIAQENGFVSLEEAMNKKSISPGDKIYAVNRNRAVALFVIGNEDIEKGMRVIGGHIDAPRIDLKPNPLYEDGEMAFFKTHYYGGIKKYQWTTIPLALHGVVILKDGTTVDISIGEDDNDPVFCITDLLIHLAANQMQKKLGEGITGENLNLLVGHMPIKDEEKEAIKCNVLRLLNAKYQMVECDFLSADLQIVPAGRARDLGFDRSMILAYAHDDRVCSYAGVRAIIEAENPIYTSVGLFVDKEEVGSMGSTGMQSKFFENTVAELINLQTDYCELKLKRALANSQVLSADVCNAYDPNYPEVIDKRNNAYMGKGVVLTKYTGSKGKSGASEASAEFMSGIRGVFNDNNVIWQIGELGKVDEGGGGTIAYILANYGADVIDCGVGVLNMHAPYEVVSKADIYEMYKGYKAFVK